MQQGIHPRSVTKPIQLLAAWLVGLILINSIFLAAATKLEPNSWDRSILIIAAIVNVPMFLMALFILQTKFRAELQEDNFYSEYLSKKTDRVVTLEKSSSNEIRLEEFEKNLMRKIEIKASAINTSSENIISWENWPVAINRNHPRFQEIRAALKAEKIPVQAIFGRSSAPPASWMISLSYALPFQNKAALLKVVIPYGFDFVQFWNPVYEAEENEDVYIGAYGDGERVRIDEELTSIINGEPEEADILDFYQTNKINPENELDV